MEIIASSLTLAGSCLDCCASEFVVDGEKPEARREVELVKTSRCVTQVTFRSTEPHSGCQSGAAVTIKVQRLVFL